MNGGPVLFQVKAPARLESLSGTWLGHEVSFGFDAKNQTWIALAGVSFETAPGTYTVTISYSGDANYSTATATTQLIIAAASTTTAATTTTVAATPAPQALFNKVGPESLEFELRVWTDAESGRGGLRSDLVSKISEALHQHQIAVR